MSAPDVACPACAAPFTPGATACPSCGIRLVGPDAVRLWEVDQQIEALRREAAVLLESMRSPLPAAPAGVPSTPANGTSQPRRRAPGLTGQGLLLGFGALLLLSAVSVFVLVAWTLIGVVGQAVLLTGATVTAALASRAASTRGLRAAAHTSAVIAIGVSVLMAQGAYSLDVAGLGDLTGSRYAAVAALVLAGLWCGYDALTARSWSATGRTSAYLPAAVLAVAVAALSLLVSVEPGGLVLGVGLLVVAALLGGVASVVHVALDTRRRRQPVGVAVLVAAASVVLGAAVLVITAYDLDLGLLERYPAGAVLVLLAALVVSAPAYVAERLGRSNATARLWSTGTRLPAVLAAVLGVGTVLLDVPGWGWAVASVVASLLLVASAWVLPGLVARAAALVAPLAAALTVLTVETSTRSVADLVRGGAGAVDTVPVPVPVEVALPGLWALACLVLLVRGPRRSHARGGLAHGGTAALLLAVAHGPWEATVPAGIAWVLLALAAARHALVHGRAADHVVAAVTAGYAVVPLLQLLVQGPDPVVQAAGTWAVAAGVAWYASAPGRLAVGHLAALLVSWGHVLLVSRWDGAALEAYTLPAAAAFAVLGVLQHRASRAAPGSVLTMGPALSIALTPTLVLAVGSDDLVRLAAVLVAGIACLVVGAGRGLRAPLLAGAGTLGVVALMQGSPYLAYVPTWLLLGCAGAVLLALGVVWESALAAGRQVGRWVHALR
ncbi:MAG: zinc ribbon domain-containing protein [Nocardioides sp.]|nr:zinc ribbon domain-containing protein [Nocardioides sp.]